MAGQVISDETVRKRTVRVSMSWVDVAAALARQAMHDAALDGEPGIDGVVAEVITTTDGAPGEATGRCVADVIVVLPV